MVPKNSILGFSNIITLNVIKKPQELFEKKIDPNLKGPFEIELSNETIILKFKNENYQFVDIPNNRDLNNAYIREGLGRAVINFVINNGEDNVVEINEIDPPEVELDFKLYNLMKSRNVKEVGLENIDEVVNIIGNNIIQKFTDAVRGLYNGN